jgi:formate hydrogenlyase subunit 4
MMILTAGGPDLALFSSWRALFRLFAACCRSGRAARGGSGLAALTGLALGMVAVAVLVGVVESSMARLRMIRIPQYLFSAGVLAALGALLMIR